jgi:hypothetical protein
VARRSKAGCRRGGRDGARRAAHTIMGAVDNCAGARTTRPPAERGWLESRSIEGAGGRRHPRSEIQRLLPALIGHAGEAAAG